MNKLKEPRTIELSSGVVLNIKAVPPMVLSKVYSKFPSEPKPPRVFMEDLGREEENPNDPDYIASMERYQLNLADSVTDAIIVLGTTLNFCPADIPHPYEAYAEWAEPLKMVGMDIPEFKEKDPQVFKAWVKYVAALETADIEGLIESVSRQSGVSEKDVAQAADQFRSDAEQPADS